MRHTLSAKTWIIGIAVVMLTACSAARLGYNNGPSLGVWWIDGYLDLDGAQERALRERLTVWFDWHRRTQMPDYAQWLATWTGRAGGEVSGDEICRWSELTRERLRNAADRIAQDTAELLPSVRPAQWDYLERRLASRLAEQRDEMAPADPAERQAASLARAVERAESFYGPITPTQRTLLAERLAGSPQDVADWLDQRALRQQAFVQGLRAAQAETDVAQRTTALTAVLRAYQRPADGEAAARQARWQAYTCETSARLHNSTSAEQREHLRERLAGWQEDVAVLAAAVDS